METNNDARYQNEMERIFKLLSNPTRLNILVLLENKQLSVNDIVQQLQITQPQVSHQLAILKEHQLVSSEKVGKKSLYQLNDPHILNVIDSTKQHVAHVVVGKQHGEL
ncbi:MULTISPECIES: helix-turn-helix transcriptional regulator [Leuconostoc]|uniref:HTH arsR-type domain-containing protein n=2 Tax=Leuconostoc kimchii TaxID=136609 RepID=D5T3C3_LEUKI|nr:MULTISPECIES: metalloregulator ArsR/SmtB family transcription factor [Leuconostoc]ADG40772.1 hypothetical protein LKI_06160 [Leuconostoc kimchii IMSNU 11154]AEJ31252.1 hypothetical protein LGMK_05975 [Leuconostoc sp. C2]QBR48338.1 ArsR family transcriptional regulator [Leuconostoc kimchii]